MSVSPILCRYRGIVDDFDAFDRASRTPLDKVFRVNGLRAVREELAQEWLSYLDGEILPVAWLPDAYRISTAGFQTFSFVAGYLGGVYHIQEEASMLPVRLLDAQPGETILDLCAAPGNKTAQLADAVGTGGTVIANDVSSSRLGVVRTAIDRLGLSNVFVTVADAADFASGSDIFDRVLADVPCSCEGTSRKNPQVLFRESTAYRDRLPELQRSILERALELCKPGGRVVYATCTYAPEECEAVVSHVMEHTRVGRLCQLLEPPVMGLVVHPGLKDWNGQTFHADMDRTIRVWPHDNDTGGFFVAIIEKREASNLAAKSGSISSLPDPELVDELPSILRDEIEQFDFEANDLRSHRIARTSAKHAWVVSSRCSPPPGLPIVGAGVRAINRKGNRNRLSTAGIMMFGPEARKQVVGLDMVELHAFLTRRPSDIADIESCSDGHCLVKANGVVFGRGVVSSNNGAARLHSFFPRIWAGMNVCTRLG